MPTYLMRFQPIIALIVGVLTLCTAAQGFFLIPYRLQMAEKEIIALRGQVSVDHDLLTRINANLEAINARLLTIDGKLNR